MILFSASHSQSMLVSLKAALCHQDRCPPDFHLSSKAEKKTSECFILKHIDSLWAHLFHHTCFIFCPSQIKTVLTKSPSHSRAQREKCFWQYCDDRWRNLQPDGSNGEFDVARSNWVLVLMCKKYFVCIFYQQPCFQEQTVESWQWIGLCEA